MIFHVSNLILSKVLFHFFQCFPWFFYGFFQLPAGAAAEQRQGGAGDFDSSAGEWRAGEGGGGLWGGFFLLIFFWGEEGGVQITVKR